MRKILSVRDNDVERLLASIPIDLGDCRDSVRDWTANIKASASQFQIDKAKANALAKGLRRG